MIERKKTFKSKENEDENSYHAVISDDQYYNEDCNQQNYNFYQPIPYEREMESLKSYNPNKYPESNDYSSNYNNYSEYDMPRMMTNNIKRHDYYKENTPEISSDNEFAEPKKPRKCGRKKIKMAFIEGKNKRSVTFSKRKKGIMKKAYELNILTGTEILLLVASESGHVYTFATPKLKPIISKHENLIQQCLNAPSGQERSMGYMMEGENNSPQDGDHAGEFYDRYNKYWNHDGRS